MYLLNMNKEQRSRGYRACIELDHPMQRQSWSSSTLQFHSFTRFEPQFHINSKKVIETKVKLSLPVLIDLCLHCINSMRKVIKGMTQYAKLNQDIRWNCHNDHNTTMWSLLKLQVCNQLKHNPSSYMTTEIGHMTPLPPGPDACPREHWSYTQAPENIQWTSTRHTVKVDLVNWFSLSYIIFIFTQLFDESFATTPLYSFQISGVASIKFEELKQVIHGMVLVNCYRHWIDSIVVLIAGVCSNEWAQNPHKKEMDNSSCEVLSYSYGSNSQGHESHD